MTNMKHKVVVITGASSGIGEAVAKLTASLGAKIVISARRSDKLVQLANLLHQQYGTEVEVVVADLQHSTGVEAIVQAAKQRFGRIDYLFSNAGYGDFNQFDANEPEKVQAMFQINVFSMMYLSQLAAIEMIENGGGQIIFVGSMAGKVPTPMTTAYSASKAAIIGYADALRLELWDADIHVTTVNPGPVKTAFFSHSKALDDYYQKVKWLALDTEVLAQKIVRNMLRKHPKRELNLPHILSAAAFSYRCAPTIGDWLTTKVFNLKG